jgi:hypothetical protein
LVGFREFEDQGLTGKKEKSITLGRAGHCLFSFLFNES